jgi:hypothetical protein
MVGSRVFDVRCFLRTKGIIKKTKTPTMGHFFKEERDGSFGEYRGTLMSALEDAATFLLINPNFSSDEGCCPYCKYPAIAQTIGHDFVDRITCTKIVKMNRDVDTQF